MKYSKEKNNGITLIALVVTIIVLLILAGVSISMLTGNNGIIAQAQKAKREFITDEMLYVISEYKKYKAEKSAKAAAQRASQRETANERA